MTVHCVRAITPWMSPSDRVNAEQVIENYMDNHHEVLENDRKILVPHGDDATDYPDYLLTQVRFEVDVSKLTLLNQLENYLQGNINWYVLQYHGCPHDEDSRDCEWTDQRSWGSPPVEVVP